MPGEILGVNKESLVRALHRMELDLGTMGNTFAYDRPTIRDILEDPEYDVKPDDLLDCQAKTIHDHTQDLGQRSTAVVLNGPVGDVALHTKFGKTIAAASRIPGLGIPAEDNDGHCDETEPRLIRSLGFHTIKNIARSRHYGQPAIIILGQDDEPIAYEKSSGLTCAYVWGEATVQTAGGPSTVPADSFAWFKYSDEFVSYWMESTAGLIAVRADERNVTNFGLARTSTRSYPPTVRKVMAFAAAVASPELESNIDAALTFNPLDVKSRVQDLMATGLVEVID